MHLIYPDNSLQRNELVNILKIIKIIVVLCCCSIYGSHNRLTELAIILIIDNFEPYFTFHRTEILTRHLNARTEEIIAFIRASVAEYRNFLISCLQELHLSKLII